MIRAEERCLAKDLLATSTLIELRIGNARNLFQNDVCFRDGVVDLAPVIEQPAVGGRDVEIFDSIDLRIVSTRVVVTRSAFAAPLEARALFTLASSE